jgi:hypothetical protein
MQEDYYAALAPVIAAFAPDNAQLRSMIYEVARSKLKEQLHRQAKVLSHSERAQQLLAFETAIEQIEADLTDNSSNYTHPGNLIPAVDPRVEIISPVRGLSHPSEARSELIIERGAPVSPLNRSALILVITVILVCLAYFGIEHERSSEVQLNKEADQYVERNTIKLSSHAPILSIPIPATYGIYAVSDGHLVELQPLPIKLSSSRITISHAIPSASTTKLPNGQVQFIAFRRDLVSNVPEKVTIRVIARVVLTSARGKEALSPTNSDTLWAIREPSYEMRVAPVRGNAAMILIHPANVDFSFPAGRYALALNALAYEFSIDGPVTDLAQCVKSTGEDAASEYKECGQP